MKRRLAALLLCTLAACPVFAEQRLTLLMFDSDECEFCARWEAEIGVVYDRTVEGRAAPLRRLPFDEARPVELILREEVRYTPTFVLLEGVREVGRITGYPGENHFWGLLDELLAAQAADDDKHIQP